MISREQAWPDGVSLADRFLSDFGAVSEFYAYDPSDPASFQRRREALTGAEGGDREALADALLAYNEKIGCTETTRRNIAKLRAANAAAVVTGQQAGVLTGPLYTIYKTITAILLARKWEAELGIPVVPVFWVASEDHDYSEINHIDLPDGRGGIERLTLPYTPHGKVSVGHLPALPAGLELIEALDYAVPDSVHKAEMLDLLRRTVQVSDNLAEWCVRLMSELFGRHGLVCFDPLEPAFRAQLGGFFNRALQANQAVGAALATATGRITAKGFAPQLSLEANNTNLFLYDAGERLPLASADGSQFWLRDRSDRSYTLAELLALAADCPDRFSPNAALRPVAQDVLFPTLAYVAGPGEIAYYAQLRDVYPVFGREMPIIYPRLSLTLLAADEAAGLARFALDPADVLAQGREAFADYLERVDPVGIDAVFDGLGQRFSAAYAELADTLSVLNPNLRPLSEGNLGRILYQVNYLRRKAKHRLRQNNRLVIREFEAILTNLQPKGEKQERVFNIFPYLIRYGAGLIDVLLGHLTPDSFSPKILTVEEDTYGNG